MIVMSHDYYQCGVVFLVLRLLCNKMRKWPPPHNRSTAITSWSPSSTPSWSSWSASISASKHFHNKHHQQKNNFFANDRGCLWKRYFSEISFSCRSSKNYDDWSVVGRIIICSIFTREDYQPITNHLQVISNHWMKFLKNNFFQRHPVQYMSKVLELQVSLTATADEFYKLAEHIYFGHCWTRHF